MTPSFFFTTSTCHPRSRTRLQSLSVPLFPFTSSCDRSRRLILSVVVNQSEERAGRAAVLGGSLGAVGASRALLTAWSSLSRAGTGDK